MIDDIAFQTNILAVNAAIEADRKENSRGGFAVIAEEIRVLSVRSQEAASDTEELIENAMQKAEEGFSIVKETAGSFEKI